MALFRRIQHGRRALQHFPSPTALRELVETVQRWVRVHEADRFCGNAAIAALKRATGHKLLGCGTERVVFPLGSDQVLKVALNGPGRDANLTEACVWQKSEEAQRVWLAPVLGVDRPNGEWLVMQRAKALRSTQMDKLNRWMRQMSDTLEWDWGFIEDTDHADQWGMLNGHPVLVDYGVVWRHDGKTGPC